jgi:hypothetical protein
MNKLIQRRPVMPRSKKTTIKQPTVPAVKEGAVGRMTKDVLELHGQTLKQELLSNGEAYNLNREQSENLCHLIDTITTKTKDKAFRQVISLFKS